MAWTEESKREFDKWMKEERKWAEVEYSYIKYNETHQADHAHRMRWRCMDFAVASLVESNDKQGK